MSLSDNGEKVMWHLQFKFINYKTTTDADFVAHVILPQFGETT